MTTLRTIYDILEKHIFDINNNNGEEKVFNIIVSKNGVVDYVYEYSSIYELHPVRSISKLVIALCVGRLLCSNEDGGGFFRNVNTPIWPLLSKIVSLKNYNNVEYLKRITIKHLLTQTVGYDNKELLLSHTIRNIDSNSLLDYVINEPIINEPGDIFVYSNASAFILSVVFQEATGQSVYAYAEDNIFNPLLINNHSWKFYGKYCAGCTGLFLSNNDMHKIGKLLLFDDNNHNEIIPKQYISDMLTPQTRINKSYCTNPLHPSSYGYFVWICDNSTCYINGNRGQYIIVSPINNTIITMQANISGAYPIIKQLIPILFSTD